MRNVPPPTGDLGAGALGARVVGDVALGEPPTGVGGPLEQLDGVAEPPVLHAQVEQGLAAADAHRGDVVGLHPDPAAQPRHDQGVAEPGVPGPHTAADRTATTDGQVGASGTHVLQHRQQVGRVEGTVAVHEGDVVGGGGHQPGVDRRAVAGNRSRSPRGLRGRAATAAVSSLDPLSTTITAKSVAPSAAAPQGEGLVAARQHQVAVGTCPDGSQPGASGATLRALTV